VKAVLARHGAAHDVHGIAHITGGGLAENLARIVPADVQVEIDRGAWQVPAVFPWVQGLGRIAADEMERVFNMGVGMVLVVAAEIAADVRQQLADLGHDAWSIGRVRAARADEDRVVVR
jgi:phosphoribosylformylglycinamidine cyclo-ligase